MNWDSSVSVTGNLTADPYYKAGVEGKKSFCSGRVAVPCNKTDTVFLSFKCFGFTADACKSFKKGQKVVLAQGSFIKDTWEKDGEEVVETAVVFESAGLVVRDDQETKEESF